MPSQLNRQSGAKLCWVSENKNLKRVEIEDRIKILKNSMSGNLLFHSDNLIAMNYLLEKGFQQKIDLIYIDPPFNSGERYFHRKKISKILRLKMCLGEISRSIWI
jgi:16S rRNA G966 N2-methylase RsmD